MTILCPTEEAKILLWLIIVYVTDTKWIIVKYLWKEMDEVFSLSQTLYAKTFACGTHITHVSALPHVPSHTHPHTHTSRTPSHTHLYLHTLSLTHTPSHTFTHTPSLTQTFSHNLTHTPSHTLSRTP